jgi:hypothetical protein
MGNEKSPWLYGLGLMMSPVLARCRSLYCESVVYIPGNALSFGPKRGQARIGSAPDRHQIRGKASRRFSEHYGARLPRDSSLPRDSACRECASTAQPGC